MSEGHSSSYDKLSQKKSLHEVLEVAISFEKIAHEFYSDLTTKVSKNLRYLVEELAVEEQMHFTLFEGLKDDPKVVEQLEEKIQIPVDDHKFTDLVHIPDLGENPDDQSILQYALSREDAAMKQYQGLADNSPDGPLKSVFQFLAYEEAQHKLELEKKYYELINQGGPSS